MGAEGCREAPTVDARARFRHDERMAAKKDDPTSASGTNGGATDGAGLSFEQTLKRLEEVVQKLERGELSLEDSLTAYEQGIALVRSAQGRLDGMDKRLEQLLHDGKSLAPMKPPET